MRQDAKHQLIQCANSACRMRESDSDTKFSLCSNCKSMRYCSKSCQRADWGRHKPACEESTARWQGTAAITAVDRVSNSGRAISIPLENIKPLLQNFVMSYHALLNISMFNAFGWTPSHLPHTSGGQNYFREARQEIKVFFITLRAVPKLSLATKGRAAFLVEDAEALTIDEFREASENGSHRLYHEGNMHHLEAFHCALEEFSSSQGPPRRASMCFIKLILESIVVFDGIYMWGDPSTDYSLHCDTDDWLQHLKQVVAKGKGWEPFEKSTNRVTSARMRISRRLGCCRSWLTSQVKAVGWVRALVLVVGVVVVVIVICRNVKREGGMSG